jgi:hypothetical protein
MFKRKEAPTVDGTQVKNIESCQKYVECNARNLKLYVTKHVVIAEDTTNLDSLGLNRVEWKARYHPADSESFEIELTLSKADFKGRFPRLMISKKARVRDGNTYVSVNGVGEDDANSLKSRVEFDKNGFLNVGQIKQAVDLINAGEIKVGTEAKKELEMLLDFEKAVNRAGAILNDVIKLPDHPTIADKLAKQEELHGRHLG